MFCAMRNKNSGLLLQDHLTLETPSTLKLRSIIGLMKIGNYFEKLMMTICYRLWNEENKDYEIKRAQIYML
jgi:hypothetical protein